MEQLHKKLTVGWNTLKIGLRWLWIGPEKRRVEQLENQSSMTFFPRLPEARDDNPQHPDVSKMPAQRPGFPKSSARHIPLQGNFAKQAEVLLSDPKLNLYALTRFGDLKRHGATWLEDERGRTLAIIRRNRQSETLLEHPQSPYSFYEVEVLFPLETVKDALKEEMLKHLVQQAQSEANEATMRLLIKEPSPYREAFKALNFRPFGSVISRYVPQNALSEALRDERKQDWLIYDGHDCRSYGANLLNKKAVKSAISFNRNASQPSSGWPEIVFSDKR